MSAETTTVVAIEDVRLASTNGAVRWLRKGEPKELGATMLQLALKTGKVSVVANAAPAPAPEPVEAAPSRDEQIAQAVAKILDEGDPNDFTAQHKPKVAAVARESGLDDVRAAEIEAALEV
jgi:hypothetical protein